MANINISYQELQNSSSGLAQGRDQIFSELDKLKNTISSLISTGFVTDSASKTFESSFSKFTQGAKNTIQGLDEVIKYLKFVEQTYRDADSQLSSAFN